MCVCVHVCIGSERVDISWKCVYCMYCMCRVGLSDDLVTLRKSIYMDP